ASRVRAGVARSRRGAWEVGIRVATRRVVPRRAEAARQRRAARRQGSHTRVAAGRRRRTPARGAHGGARRSWASSLDARDARALAARARRRTGDDRLRVRRRTAYTALALVCAVPRLGILLHERDAITASFTEKSDTIARMFVDHGTFGFVPGAPSAYTQPLYAWFLIPIDWIFGANWWSIGTVQIVVAVAVA